MGYHVQYKGHREIREKKFTEAAHKQDQGHRDRFLLHFLRFFHRRKHEKLRDVSKFHPHVRALALALSCDGDTGDGCLKGK